MLLLSIAFTTASFAQPYFFPNWKRVYQFPAQDGYISASYFFNPQVGIIGFHWNISTSTAGMVKRTTDGGNTWTDCMVPMLVNTTPQVTDIWFSDQDSGWMTVAGNLNTNDPRLWRTIDGGKTWTGIAPIPGMTGPTSVRQTPSAINVSEGLAVGLWTSTDLGGTWNRSSADRKNGLDFEDNLTGIASEYGMNSTTTFLYTTDGGVNWKNVPGGIQHEAWGVYAIKHSQVFVAAPEDTTINGVSLPSPIYRSTDKGLYWNLMTTLPIRTTGGIHGVNGVIYVQSCGGIPGALPGLWVSLDSGQNWQNVRGPDQGAPDPYSVCDTRFSVTGCGNVVYASDNAAGLWKTTDGGDSTISFAQCIFVDKDSLKLDASILCDTSKKIYFLHNPNFGPINIEDLRIVDSLDRPVTTSGIYFDSLPPDYPSTVIQKNDSVAFGLAWHPGAEADSTFGDSVIVRVIFYAPYLSQYPESGLNPTDTVYLRLKLVGNSTAAEFTVIPKSIKDTLTVCRSVDSTILFVNQGCDSIAITQAQLLKNNWVLSDVSGDTMNFPIIVHKDDSLRFRVRGTPTGPTYLQDSLLVKMHYEGHDTLWGTGLRTIAKGAPGLVTAAKLDFDSLATCDTTISPLPLTNAGCDTISITKADLSDAHFELVDAQGNPLTLPVIIAPDSSQNVYVRFIPMTLTTSKAPVTFHFHRYVYSAFDGKDTVMLTGSGAPSGSLKYDSVLALGSVPICGGAGTPQTITLKNYSCNPDLVKSFTVNPPFVWTNSNVLPTTIPPGKTLDLTVEFTPTQKGLQTDTAQLLYALPNGKVDTVGTVLLTGTGTNGVAVFSTSLASSTLSFPSISECGQPDSITFGITNSGCDTLTVTSIPLDASLTGTLVSFANKALPAKLSNKDTLFVTVAVSQLVAGNYNGNLNIDYTLADGSQHDSTAPVSLSITKGGGADTLSMMNATNSITFAPFFQCDSPDTTLVFQFKGCGTIPITQTLTGTGFVMIGGKSSLSNGDWDTITIAYDGSTTGNLSSTLSITPPASTTGSFTIQFSGSVRPPQAVHFALGLSQTSIAARDNFFATLTPDIILAASPTGLTTVQGVFSYPQNNFQVSPMSDPHITKQGATDAGGIEQYSFTYTNVNGISLDDKTALIYLPLTAMVSDSVGGTISATGFVLNNGDAHFGNCELSISGAPSATTTFQYNCGDTTLIRFLKSHQIVLAEDPRPNPVTSETGFQTTVTLLPAVDGTIEIQLFNALGETIAQDAVPVTANESLPYSFHLANVPSGSYYYSMRLTSSIVSSPTLRGTFQVLK